MKSYLHQWCAWAMESGVRQMQQLGKTLLGHASGILAWWKARLTSAPPKRLAKLFDTTAFATFNVMNKSGNRR